MDKKNLRSLVLKEIRSLSKNKFNLINFLITKQLIKFLNLYPHFIGQIGSGYIPLSREFAPDFNLVIQRFSLNLGYPVLENQQMRFGLPDGEIDGKIWLNPPFRWVEPSWVLVPGVAFDLKGSRLGRGKGYFDRYLSDRDVIKIGIAYSSQILRNLPIEPHDCSMDFIITEKFCWSVSQQNYL